MIMTVKVEIDGWVGYVYRLMGSYGHMVCFVDPSKANSVLRTSVIVFACDALHGQYREVRKGDCKEMGALMHLDRHSTLFNPVPEL